MKIIEIDNDQSSMILNDHEDDDNKDNSVKQNAEVAVIDSKNSEKKQQPTNNNDVKIVKLLMLTISDQLVQTLSYNYPNNTDQSNAIQRLSHWLEWRHSVFTSSIYHMLGLTNRQIYGKSCDPGIVKNRSSKNNLDLLLDYKSYVAAAGDNKEPSTTVDKNSRTNSNRTKPVDNDMDDKRKKSIQYTKDIQDSFIEQLVKNSKQKHKIGENILICN